MTTVYKFKCQFTKSKVGATPANAPTIKIADTANNLLVNGASATAIANLAGVYYYNYTGADGLDLVGVFNTADTTVDYQDLPSYTPDILTIKLDTATSAIPAAVWAVLTSSLTAAGSIGKLVTDTLTQLATMFVADGLVWKYTANALEESPTSTATVAVTTSQAAQVAAGNLSMTSHFSGSQAFTSTISADLSTAVIWLAIKSNKFDDDDKSLFFVKTTTGLVYVNGAAPVAPVVAADASITVTGSSGAWVITAAWNARASAVLDGLEGDYYLAIKYSLGTDDLPVSEGAASLNQGGIQAV